MTTLPRDNYGEAVPVIYPGDTVQKITFAAVNVQSAPVAATTTVVRLYATADCFIVFGANPVADNAKTPLKAGTPEYFAIKPGDKVAAIQSSAGGDLYITEGENFAL